MASDTFDLNDLKRRMDGATAALKHELGGLRTGRAAISMVEPVQVEAYGSHMPLNQVATVSVPEPRLLSVQVWDKSMVKAVETAIVNSNLGLSPATEGQVIRLRIPELNEDRRKELVKVAHKYAEAARVAIRHVRRDGLDIVKKLQKDGKMSEVPGSEFEIKADLVFLAMGFVSPVGGVLDAFGVGKDSRGNARANTDGEGCYATDVPKVFAAGDVRRGQSLVVWAIREGRQCAREVDQFLMGSTTLPR